MCLPGSEFCDSHTSGYFVMYLLPQFKKKKLRKAFGKLMKPSNSLGTMSPFMTKSQA